MSNSTTVLDLLLARFPQAKRQTLKRMVEARRVLIDGAPARALKQRVMQGASIVVKDRADASSHMPATRKRESPLDVIFEDADLLVVNKPVGLLTSTVPREPRETLLKRVREHLAARDPDARAGLIHRLDRDASGLLVFSKNDLAYRSLKAQFKRHSVERVYVAVVRGVPTPRAGTIDSRLIELKDGIVRSTHGDTPGKDRGERAITEYESLETRNKRSLLRVRLRTGRKHQIRAQLAERGVPIVGDRVYGREESLAEHRLLLHAAVLGFTHPRDGRAMRFEVEAGFGCEPPIF